MRLLDKLCAVMEFLLASHVVFRSEVDKYKVLVGEIPFLRLFHFGIRYCRQIYEVS